MSEKTNSTISTRQNVGIAGPAAKADFEQIPIELRTRAQWLVWRLDERDGRPTKVPYDAKSGRRAKSNDPATWSSFETVVTAYQQQHYSGIGFAFQAGDDLTGIDLDHVIDPATGEIDQRAMEILERFQCTYCEISPSGAGLRIFAHGMPGRTGKNEGRAKWLEVYDHTSPRYLTVTGHHWKGSASTITEQQDALDWLHAKYFVKPAASKPVPTTRPTPDLEMDDAALLLKARNASNGGKFRALYDRGDANGYGDDDSAADLALANLLAFWTNRDPARIDRLFRQSALMRPKWDERRGASTYGQMTIDKAKADCRETYGNRTRGEDTHRKEKQEPPPADGDDPGYSPDDDRRQSGRGPESNGSTRKVDISELCYRKLSDIRARPTIWEWYPLIPRRASTIVTGDSDVGKSKAIASIVSIATNGGKYPGTNVEVAPGNVIILSAEEDAETVLKPALLAAGADCNRVYLVDSCAEYDSRGRIKRRLVTLEHDIKQLKILAAQIGNVSLVIIDPITAYLGTRISGNENTAIRNILGGLQSFAEEHGNANILVTHFNKDGSKSAKKQVIGSVAFVAGVRSVIGVFRDPEDETSARRLLVPVKCNLVPEQDRFGIAFEINGVDVQDGDTLLLNIGVVNWIPGRVTKIADEIIADQQNRFEETRNSGRGPGLQRQRVIDVLRAAGRPLSAREIAEILEGESIPDKTDKRRGRVRKLLREMLAAGQVHQLETEEYTLTPDGGEYVDF